MSRRKDCVKSESVANPLGIGIMIKCLPKLHALMCECWRIAVKSACTSIVEVEIKLNQAGFAK